MANAGLISFFSEMDRSTSAAQRFYERLRRSYPQIGRHPYYAILPTVSWLEQHFPEVADEALNLTETMIAFRVPPQVLSAAAVLPLFYRKILPKQFKGTPISASSLDLARRVTDLIIQQENDALDRVMRSCLEEFSRDVQVAYLFLGWQVNFLENVADKQRNVKDVLELYVPIADKLGLGKLRTRLEDACFRLLHPDLFDRLTSVLNLTREADEQLLRVVQFRIREILARNQIKGRVSARKKGVYSLYRKMNSPGEIDQGMRDRLGVRIIVPSIRSCYRSQEILAQTFPVLAETYDDYIAAPKRNGYRSLHFNIAPLPEERSSVVEIQIRTPAMHYEAEFGMAAHWRYKSQLRRRQEENRVKFWLSDLAKRSKESLSPHAIAAMLARESDDKTLLIQAPDGKLQRVPQGMTLSEFLKETESGAKQAWLVQVNGEKKGLDYVLQDGDVIEIFPLPF